MLSDEPADGLSLLVPVTLFPSAVFGLHAVVQAARRRYSPLPRGQNVAVGAKSNVCLIDINIQIGLFLAELEKNPSCKTQKRP